jgi:hypothetical protein
MFRRSPKPPRLAGDNPLLRHRFEAELHTAELELDDDYAEWLRAKGIDPGSGTMTEHGIASFKTLIEEQNTLNR